MGASVGGGDSLRRSEDVLELWLVRLILLLRQELREFAREEPESFVWWLVNSGAQEYKAVRESDELRTLLNAEDQTTGLTLLEQLVLQHRPDVQLAHPPSAGVLAYKTWFYQHGVSEHELWDFLDEKHRLLAGMFVDDPGLAAPPAVSDAVEQPFGVNLIGYAFGELGIGEDLRMAAKALHSASVPFTIVNFPPGRDVAQNDRSLHGWVTDTGPYRYNIYCLTALEHGRFYAERGAAQMRGRYNIGYWPWELGVWPAEWNDLFRLVDEVWASSQHTLCSVSAVSPVPCRLVPMAVEIGSLGRKGRAAFRLPLGKRLFCFAFDMNSSIHRKNATACLEAFTRAFPAGRSDVGLILKAHGRREADPVWNMIKSRVAVDSRIHVFEQTLPRGEVLALYRACDCFVSLHRAEGFGRSIAEALQLGLHVIATAYSGNVDYCRAPGARLIPFRLIPVGDGQYPFSSGAEWADPDVAAAAMAMRRFADRKRGWVRRDRLPARYSVPAVGAAYRRQLLQLELQRRRR